MDKAKLLIIEDEEVIRSQMKWALDDDYAVLLAEDRASAIERFKDESPPLVILDLGLPPDSRGSKEGFKTLTDILTISPGVKLIVITGNQEKKNALTAVETGAFDFFVKPADINEVKIVLKRALNMANLEMENIALKERVLRNGFDGILGESPGMREVYSIIRKVATTDVPVLVVGESGTGKELVSRAIHRSSNRSEGPFIAINCGAIPETLLESELFGHEKGSFTGADSRRNGKIEYAQGGTLFLDEVGEMPLQLQVKLLRFLQEHQIERVGGREKIPVNVRVIAATNRDLEKEIEEGRFREDLYYRLSVINIELPPLRDRGDDVFFLARAFLKKFASEQGNRLKSINQEALDIIKKYKWPGNVRELENRVRRAVIMSTGKFVSSRDLALDNLIDRNRVETLREFREKMDRDHIMNALKRRGWNVSRTAKDLGVSRPTLHGLIKKHKLIKKE